MGVVRIWLAVLATLLLSLPPAPVRAQAPSYQDKGAPASGTNGVSPAWPAHQPGDIAFLIMETRGNVTPSLLTANGFASVGSNNAVNSAAGTRLTVFWARATSSPMLAPVINNTTDHVYAQILTYRGVLWAGNPWNATATGNKTTASMTANVTGVTPTDTNSLIVQVATRPNDSAAAFVTGLVNANLTGITLRSDEGTTVGDGGGFAVWDGVRALNAATGTTAANFNVSVVNAFRALALRPAKYYSIATGNWGTAGTWSTTGCGVALNPSPVVPPAGADVTICTNHIVTLNVSSANLNSLTIQANATLNIGDGTARTLTVSPAAALPAGTIVNNGMLRYNAAGNHTITTNGTFTNNGTLTSLAGIAGTRTLTATGLISNSSTGTITFAGNAITTVNANGGFTNDGTINVDVNSNVTHVINMRGNFINNSNNVSLRADANSLVNTVFNATTAQTVTGSVANTNFGNVTVSNANGVTLTGTHNMTVQNTLNFTVDGSIVTTGSNLVQIGSLPLNLVGSVTNANANRFVNGNLQRYFTAAGTFNFDVGSTGPNRYSPVQVQLGVAPSTDGSLLVSTASGDHAQIGSSGFDAAKTVNRTWTLTNAGLVFGANANNRVRFTFVAGDIDGGGTLPANFHIGRYTGAWTLTPPPTPNAQPLFTEISGTTITSATLTGDFQVGEKAPVVTPPDSFNAVEVGAAVNGRIFTKLRSAGFTLDIVALNSGGALEGGFADTVQVDLIANAAATTCAGGTPIGSTSQNVNLTAGRGTTTAFTVATAYSNVRVRIQYPSLTLTRCSADNFSIKPTAFSVTSTDATNLTTGGTTIFKTGATFNLTAAGGAGYTGTPGTNFTGNVTGTPTAGTLGPVAPGFLAADGSGSASGTFYYGEVGHFGLLADAVRDTSFTSVDPSGTDCVASSTSETLSGGQYGCWIGSAAVAPVTGLGFGRFIPDNFNVAYTTPPIFGTTCGTFTYVGTLFTYPGSTGIMTVTARAGTANGLANATTVNYAGSYVKLTTATLNQAPYNTKAARYTRHDALNPSPTPALDHTGLPDTATDPTVSAFASGVGTLTFSSGTGLMFTRDNAAPNAQFNADIALALNVIDGDAVAFGSNPASFGTATSGGGISFSGGKTMRYGRLRLSNANGSQLVPLAMPMETQYWNGSSFITNADDNCTSLGTASVGLGNYTANLAAGETTATIAAGNFSKGRKMLTLSAPGAANNGGVEVVLNLGTTTTIDTCPAWTPPTPTPAAGSLTHLRGRWCGATHTKDPTARARFGVFRGSEEVIHNRENF